MRWILQPDLDNRPLFYQATTQIVKEIQGVDPSSLRVSLDEVSTAFLRPFTLPQFISAGEIDCNCAIIDKI